MDEKLKKIVYIGLGVCIIIFLFLFIITSCDKKIKPKDLELKIVTNAKKYYKKHTDELPSENGILSVSLDELTEKGIIKEVSKLIDKKTTCSGSLTIENNNDYYMYSPNLTCTSEKETYQSENLKDTLLENIVNEGNGLYKIGNAYYFRGDEVDNNLIFDGIKWKITKINEDGTIRLIENVRRRNVVWDDRYNEEKRTTSGRNSYIYNGMNSRIKETLDDIYNLETVLSNDGKGYIKKTNLCIGKRSEEDTINDGSIECSETLNNQYLGLLQVNEYMLASLDAGCTKTTSQSCKNYNYLATFNNTYWTITADKTNTHKVFKINTTPYSTNASSYGLAKIVINISENTSVTGTGTEDDPYLVVGFDTELKDFKK